MFAHSRPFFYRRLASPLHAARAGVGAMWALALTAATLMLFHPLVLLALTLAVLGAGYGAGVGRQLTRTLRTAAIVVVPIVAINVLVSRDGLTVFARLGDLGPFGQGDLTVEAAVYGAVIGLKVTLLILVTTLASLAVDPDELLRAPAPAVVSLRAHRLALHPHDPAARGRLRAPGRGPAHPARGRSHRPSRARRAARGRRRRLAGSRDGRRRHARAARLRRWPMAIARSSIGRRARGRSTSSRVCPVRRAGRRCRSIGVSPHVAAQPPSVVPPRSRVRLLGRCVLALCLLGRLAGAASFDAYPLVHMPVTAATGALCVALIAAILLPFADRRGIDP